VCPAPSWYFTRGRSHGAVRKRVLRAWPVGMDAETFNPIELAFAN
jgi:hypothetical protein